MQILLVGHGKMGRMVESLAGEYGCVVAGVIDPQSPTGQDGPDAERWRGVDVAIDFSSPDAVVKNVPVLAKRGMSVVIGTTGWQKDEAAIRQAVAGTEAGIVAAPNFSTGVVLFEAIVAQAAIAEMKLAPREARGDGQQAGHGMFLPFGQGESEQA